MLRPCRLCTSLALRLVYPPVRLAVFLPHSRFLSNRSTYEIHTTATKAAGSAGRESLGSLGPPSPLPCRSSPTDVPEFRAALLTVKFTYTLPCSKHFELQKMKEKKDLAEEGIVHELRLGGHTHAVPVII